MGPLLDQVSPNFRENTNCHLQNCVFFLCSLDNFQVPSSAVWCSSHHVLPQVCLLLTIPLPYTVIYFLRRHERSWSSRRQAGLTSRVCAFRCMLSRQGPCGSWSLFQIHQPITVHLDTGSLWLVPGGSLSWWLEWHLLWCCSSRPWIWFLSHSFGVLLSQQLFQLGTASFGLEVVCRKGRQYHLRALTLFISFAGCLRIFLGVKVKPSKSSFPIATLMT